MTSTASYPARQLKRRRNAWMRRNASVVALIVVGVAGRSASSSALMLLTVPMPVRLYALGFVHAGLIAAGLHLLNSAFLAHDQEAVCLARLGPGVRRRALHAAAHRCRVWLSSGLQSVGHRDEAWLERGLPSS